jgi:murein tripeptide amidase MpaA
VHPSESPSSFAAEGVINFMTNRKDLRSHRLRENFVVMVIPMLNPDGVAMGNFRYDDIGQNLNRYYIEPDPNEQ